MIRSRHQKIESMLFAWVFVSCVGLLGLSGAAVAGDNGRGHGHHHQGHHGHHGSGHHGHHGHHGNGHHHGHHQDVHVTSHVNIYTPRPSHTYIHYEDRPRYDYARVERVEPIYETRRVSRPSRQCWDEPVQRYEHRSSSSTGTILGGIVGAAVGNHLGHHESNKQVGAVAGAVLGASVGHDLSRGHGTTYVRNGYETRCNVSHEYNDRETVVGYYVTYRYRGVRNSIKTDYHPGRQIRIRVF